MLLSFRFFTRSFVLYRPSPSSSKYFSFHFVSGVTLRFSEASSITSPRSRATFTMLRSTFGMMSGRSTHCFNSSHAGRYAFSYDPSNFPLTILSKYGAITSVKSFASLIFSSAISRRFSAVSLAPFTSLMMPSTSFTLSPRSKSVPGSSSMISLIILYCATPVSTASVRLL